MSLTCVRKLFLIRGRAAALMGTISNSLTILSPPRRCWGPVTTDHSSPSFYHQLRTQWASKTTTYPSFVVLAESKSFIQTLPNTDRNKLQYVSTAAGILLDLFFLEYTPEALYPTHRNFQSNSDVKCWSLEGDLWINFHKGDSQQLEDANIVVINP